jgi:hypothetical protein
MLDRHPLASWAVFAALIGTAGLACHSWAQEAPKLALKVDETVRVVGVAAPPLMTIPLKCDAQGNLYFRG